MRILILGSGVIGTTLAYFLIKKGMQVTVFDRQAGPALETSYGNAGQISPGYASPWAAPGLPFKVLKWLSQRDAPLAIKTTKDCLQYRWMMQMLGNCTTSRYAVNKERMVRMSEYSRDCLDQLRKDTGISYEELMLGTMQLFRTQQQLDNAAKDIKVLKEANVPYEILDKEGITKIEPALSPVVDKLVGALRLPNDETGDCYLFTTRLAKIAEQLGVEFKFNRIIEKLHVSGNVINGVWIDGELVRADRYILCLGSYTPQLLAPLGIYLPVYPLKGYSLTIPIINPSMSPSSTILDETYKVAITRFDQRIRVGGMAEICGYDLSLTARRQKTLEKVTRDLYPDAGDMNQAVFWTGLRPTTPDGTPVIGETRINHLYLNTGHGTLGWTMAAGSGRYLSDIIAGDRPEISTEGYAISRYQ